MSEQGQRHEAPAWTQHVMWWQVYPLGIDGRDVRGEHVPAGPGEGLQRLHPYLDHLISLGLNGLALGPIFTSSTHGYDTLDHLAVDPRLGTAEDFAELVAACRARGIKILLDGVFNHVGEHHPLARRALAEGPSGEYADWFRIDWDAEGGPRFADLRGTARWSRSTMPTPRCATTSPTSCASGSMPAPTGGGWTRRTPSIPTSGRRCCRGCGLLTPMCGSSGR